MFVLDLNMESFDEERDNEEIKGETSFLTDGS